MLRPKKILLSINTAWNVANFRGGLINALNSEGYEVVVAAPADEYVSRIAALGARFISLPMDNQGTHPGRDLLLLWRYWRLLLRERPDVFLGYTVKPNVYGSLAAHAFGIPVINNVAGLGTVFIKDSWLTRFVRWLYRLALSRSFKVFFQNEDDRRMFVEAGLVRSQQTDRVPGSGVDLRRFAPVEGEAEVNVIRKFRFLLIARMLWDKGVGEYVKAARQVRQRFPNVEFCLLGFLDVQNPTAISRMQMADWVAEGIVNYLGETDDVRPHLAMADCVVLPSFYREGVPRALLEAAAMGLPIITTDAVGCREVLDDGVSGFFVRPRDASDLVEKLEMIITMPASARAEMGCRGRKKMEREFDERIVIEKYLATVEAAVAAGYR